MHLKDVEPRLGALRLIVDIFPCPVIVGSELHKVVEEVRISILIAALLNVLFTH